MTRSRVEHVLMSMGVPANIKGFTYIVESVLMLDMPEWKHPKWIALYDGIGRRYGSTGSRVERAIRHAFDVARNRDGNYKLVDHYIGFANANNAASLAMLYRMLKEEDVSTEAGAKVSEALGLSEVSVRNWIRQIVRETVREMMETRAV